MTVAAAAPTVTVVFMLKRVRHTLLSVISYVMDSPIGTSRQLFALLFVSLAGVIGTQRHDWSISMFCFCEGNITALPNSHELRHCVSSKVSPSLTLANGWATVERVCYTSAAAVSEFNCMLWKEEDARPQSSASSAGRLGFGFGAIAPVLLSKAVFPESQCCNRRIQAANSEWNVNCEAVLFLSGLPFAVASDERCSYSFWNWIRLAPLSTMMRPICRSLSQMGNVVWKQPPSEKNLHWISTNFRVMRLRRLFFARTVNVWVVFIVHFVDMTMINFPSAHWQFSQKKQNKTLTSLSPVQKLSSTKKHLDVANVSLHCSFFLK